MDKVLILVIDGCAPEYITPGLAPNIHRLAKKIRVRQNRKGRGANRNKCQPRFHFIGTVSLYHRHGGQLLL